MKHMITDILSQLKDEKPQSFIICDSEGENFDVKQFDFELDGFTIIAEVMRGSFLGRPTYSHTSGWESDQIEEKISIEITEIFDEECNDLKGGMMVSDLEAIIKLVETKIVFEL